MKELYYLSFINNNILQANFFHIYYDRINKYKWLIDNCNNKKLMNKEMDWDLIGKILRRQDHFETFKYYIYELHIIDDDVFHEYNRDDDVFVFEAASTIGNIQIMEYLYTCIKKRNKKRNLSNIIHDVIIQTVKYNNINPIDMVKSLLLKIEDINYEYDMLVIDMLINCASIGILSLFKKYKLNYDDIIDVIEYNIYYSDTEYRMNCIALFKKWRDEK